MVETIFQNLTPLPEEETKDSPDTDILPAVEITSPADSDDSLLVSLEVVQKIVRKKQSSSWRSEAIDIVSGAILRLLKYRRKNKEKSQAMSNEEWENFSAKAALNEIKRHYSKNSQAILLSLEEIDEPADPKSLEGETSAEVMSLIRALWQEFCSLTLRQRRALILQNQKFTLSFLDKGISDNEFAISLEISLECWMAIRVFIPFKDIEIAELLREAGNGRNIESISNSIKKARFEARNKLRRVTEKK